MKPIRQLVTAAAVAGAAACAAAPAVTPFGDADVAAIESTTERALAVFNAAPRDWQAYVDTYYADDAWLHMDGAASAHGRTEIRTLLSQYMEVEKLHLEPFRVEGNGDLAYVSGTATVTDAEHAAHHFRYVEAWKRQPDGSWKVIEDISNLQPATP